MVDVLFGIGWWVLAIGFAGVLIAHTVLKGPAPSQGAMLVALWMLWFYYAIFFVLSLALRLTWRWLA